MLISKEKFNQFNENDQKKYLYLFSSYYHDNAEIEAIEFTEKMKIQYTNIFNEDINAIEKQKKINNLLNERLEKNEWYQDLKEDIEKSLKEINKIIERYENDNYELIGFDCEGNKIKSYFRSEKEADEFSDNHGIEIFSIKKV